MNNATAGLGVLFQRGVGPSHILLLQEIRAHNSSEQSCGAQPLAHHQEFTFADDQVMGQATGNKKSVSSQKFRQCS